MLHKAKSVQAPTITRKHAQAAQKILSKIPFHGDRDAFTNLITISRDQLPEDAGEATLFLKNICQDMRISSSSFFDLGVINLSLDPSLSRMEDFELKQHVQALKFCFFIDSLPAAVCIFDSKSILLGVASATNKHQQDFLVALAEARAFVDIQSSLTLFNNAVAMTFDSSLGQKAMTSLQAMTAKQAKTNGGSRQNQSLVSKESVITLKSSLRLTALKTNGTAGIPHSTWGPFERLMHAAIEMPSGLTIGPDSDGLLNFCDKGRMRMDVPISRASSSSSSSPPADQKGVELPTSLTDFPSLMSSISIVADDFAMRSAKAPKGVKSKSHPFQLQGLQWMLDRERKEDACNRGVVSLHPAWTQLISADGKEVLYVNRSERKVSRYFTPAPIQTTCGGMVSTKPLFPPPPTFLLILIHDLSSQVCDEMGLGKTLMTLMLIASNPCPSDWPTTGKGEQAVQHWATEEAASGKKQALQSSLCLCAVPTTLIIAPANLLQQWAAEVIQQHTHHVAPLIS